MARTGKKQFTSNRWTFRGIAIVDKEKAVETALSLIADHFPYYP